MIKAGLEKILDQVTGALGVTLIGVDGLPIADISRKEGLDVSVLGAELTLLYKNAQRTTGDMDFGEFKEVSIVAENTVVICRAVTKEYFLLLALSPEALMGRGRYELRKSVDNFREQLL